MPPRRFDHLPAALHSVFQQDHPVAAISIATDLRHDGAWVTRQRALDAVRTKWTAFLDDDDEFYSNHVGRLLACALEHDADYTYSYFDTTRTSDVLKVFGQEFDPLHPIHTTMTVLVKTDLAKEVGFTARDQRDEVGGEDWRFTLGCVAAGAKIVHLPEQTWHWRWHLGNTAGREDRW